MNDLIRPTLYESYHFIWPTKPAPQDVPARRDKALIPHDAETVDVVGPICESGGLPGPGTHPPPRAARRPAGRLHRRRLWLRP